MADILYCTTTANFGQPEIKLGTLPEPAAASVSREPSGSPAPWS